MSDEHTREIRFDGADRLVFLLTGPEGAIQFVLKTHWTSAAKCMASGRDITAGDHLACHPMPLDVGYHSRTRNRSYQSEEPTFAHCPLLDGPCWYDGSGLQAEELFELFCLEGTDAVWRVLEDRYQGWLVDEKDAE